MKVLLIILAVILFFILLLSIKVGVLVHSEGGVEVTVKWLFIKIGILPRHEKKKKKKPKKKKKEKPKDETVKEPKQKGDNIFLKFYHNNGVSGVVDLLERTAHAVGGMFRRVGRAFIFDELYISLKVGTGDSADTAIRYGKVCSAVYPAMGLMVDTMRVKKYSVEVKPDFIEGKNDAKLHTLVSFRPIALINALIVTGFALIFKVGIKFLKGLKAKDAPAHEGIKNKT